MLLKPRNCLSLSINHTSLTISPLHTDLPTQSTFIQVTPSLIVRLLCRLRGPLSGVRNIILCAHTYRVISTTTRITVSFAPRRGFEGSFFLGCVDRMNLPRLQPRGKGEVPDWQEPRPAEFASRRSRSLRLGSKLRLVRSHNNSFTSPL